MSHQNNIRLDNHGNNTKNQGSDPTHPHSSSTFPKKNHEEDPQDSTIVRNYLSRCGLDTSSLSMDDFDKESFRFLKDMCNEKIPSRKDSDTRDDDLASDSRDAKNSSKDTNGQANDRRHTPLGTRASVANERISVDVARIHSFNRLLFDESNDEREYHRMIHSSSFMPRRLHQEMEDRPFGLMPNQRKDDDKDPSIQHQSYYSETLAKENSSFFSTEKQKEEVEELDFNQLEPWQRALFQQLQRQEKSIEECQKRIDSLTHFIAVNAATIQKTIHERDKSNVRSSSTDAQDAVQQRRFSTVNPSSEQDQTTRGEPPQPPMMDNHNMPMPILSLLETFLDQLFDIPRAVYKYILSTRPVRVMTLLHREAQEFRFPLDPNQRFLDVPLMIQLGFMCLFLRARIGSMQKRGSRVMPSEEWGGIVGELMAVWKEHGEVMLVLAAITVYMMRTGLILFLYRVIFKDNVIAKVWRDEDLAALEDENQNLQQDEDNHGNGNGNQGAMNAAEGNVGEHDPVLLRDVQRRRRERIRMPVDGHQPHQDLNDQGRANQNNAARNLEANNPRPQVARDEQGGLIPNFQLNDTFVGGGLVDPPFDAEEMAAHANAPPEELFLGQMMEGFKDVLYLVGSFVLSIIPLWWPKAREVRRNVVPPVDGDAPAIDPGRDVQINQEEEEGQGIIENEAGVHHKSSNHDAVHDQDEDDSHHDNDQGVDDASSS
jgi:hypothetical protein